MYVFVMELNTNLHLIGRANKFEHNVMITTKKIRNLHKVFIRQNLLELVERFEPADLNERLKTHPVKGTYTVSHN